MSGAQDTTPMTFEGSFESLPAAQRVARESAVDGKAYYIFESVGCFVQEISWIQPEQKPVTR